MRSTSLGPIRAAAASTIRATSDAFTFPPFSAHLLRGTSPRGSDRWVSDGRYLADRGGHDPMGTIPHKGLW